MVAVFFGPCLLGPAEAAPWLQYGVTEDQSSYTTDPGPATNDTAWRLRLTGSRAAFAWPIIVGGYAYVLEGRHALTMEDSQNQIHRIELATGRAERFGPVHPQYALTWASDGESLFLAGSDYIQAVRLSDGALTTRMEFPDVAVPDRGPFMCRMLVVVDATLYAFCYASANHVPGSGNFVFDNFGRPFKDGPQLLDDRTLTYPFVASYEIATGLRRWTFFVDAPKAVGQDAPPEIATASALTGYPRIPYPGGMSVMGDFVAVSGMHVLGWRDEDRGDHQGECWLYLIDESTGKFLARFMSSDPAYSETGATTPNPDDATKCGMPAEPRWDAKEKLLFGKFQRVFSVDLRPPYRYVEVQPRADASGEVMAGAAYDGRRLFVSSYQRITQFNSVLDRMGTPFHIPAEDKAAFADHAPVLAKDTLFAMAHNDVNNEWFRRSVLYALRPGEEEVSLLWKMELPHEADSVYGFNYLASVGDGMLVMAGMDGHVIALGSTMHSPVPVAEVLDPVEVGRPFRVDLARSRAGAQGAPSQFRADWGDGTSTGWQTEPVLTHTYQAGPPQGGSFTARFQVRNDAGQSNSTFLTLLDATPRTQGDDPSFVFQWLAGLSALAALVLLALLIVTRRRLSEVYLLVKGRAADRFTVIRELGRGSFGVAQLAHDRKLGREVVLKQPYGSVRLSDAQRERFLREAQVAAKVQHPNVVTVFEVIPEEEPPILVLEYAPGGSLEDRFRTGQRFSTQEARQLTIDLLQGLAAVHAAGIVHRDLKPSNVLVDADGRGKVSDFGVARLDGQAAEETRAWGSNLPGTLAYMSPEQLGGRPATKASDQYAAASIAYRLFTGRSPTDGNDWSPEAVRARILAGPKRLDAPEVPHAIRPVLAKALSLDPAKRFPDAKAFLAEFASASIAGGEKH